MTITLLPESTVRAIGSTLVLNDACSVVKELIENSLDAKASSISVEISANTLDTVQVRDNGIGISPEDRKVVCRPNCTSKLDTIDDLNTIGPKSLGFRGQALASVAELSGEVLIHTRIDGDVVGTKLKYSRSGELVRSENASHPVGTTVRIQDFLKHIPVRRQTATKSATKILTAIKRMVQAYAFARPHIRFLLKVLKSKTETHSWIYGPKPNATIKDVAARFGGQEMASQCEMKTLENDSTSSGTIDIGHNETEQASFQIVALVPRPDADFSKISSGGQFISIDGRPISTTRGFGKDISKLYKKYIRSAASRQKSNVNDPFICIHIQCPEGSYDINIEPAKDDVLFANNISPIDRIEEIFKNIYGDVSDKEKSATIQRKPKTTEQEPTFDLLLAKHQNPHTEQDKPRRSSNIAIATSDNAREGLPIDFVIPEPSIETAVGADIHNMGSLDQDDLIVTPTSPDGSEISDVDESQIGSHLVTNPWSLAKVNSSTRSQKMNGTASSPVQDKHPRFGIDNSSSSPISSLAVSRNPTTSGITTLLPSPDKSPSPVFFSNPGPPIRPFKNPLSVRNEANGLQASIRQVNHIPRVSGNSVSPNSILPFKTPLRRDNLTGQRLSQSTLTSLMSSQDSSTEADHQSFPDTNLDEAMEFEFQKKAAQQAQRRAKLNKSHQTIHYLSGSPLQLNSSGGIWSQKLPSSQNSVRSVQSPHHNRYLAAKSSLAPPPSSQTSNNSLPSSQTESRDPEPVALQPLDLGGQHLTNSTTRISRKKSHHLPFESTPKGQELHTLQSTVHIPPHALSQPSNWPALINLYAPSSGKGDSYIKHSGTIEQTEYISSDWADGDLGASTKEIKIWESRLKELVNKSLLLSSAAETEQQEPPQSKSPAADSSTPPMPDFNLFRSLKAFVDDLFRTTDSDAK